MSWTRTFVIYILVYATYVVCQRDSENQIPIIKKCVCDASKVETENGCVDYGSQYVKLWHDTKEEEKILDLTLVNSSVVIEPVMVCPPNTTKERYEEFAFISMMDGALITFESRTNLYCIENVLNPDGRLMQRVETCSENIALRTCCNVNEIVDARGICRRVDSIPIDSPPVKWLTKFNRFTEGVSCQEESPSLEHFPLVTKMNELKQLLLNLQYQTSNKYCLNLFEANETLEIGVLSCSPVVPNIPHCCREDEAFNLDNENPSCVSHSEPFSFPENMVWPSHGAMTQPSVMNCSYSLLSLNKSASHPILPDGSLLLPSGTSIPFHKYCLGAVIQKNVTYHSGLTCLLEDVVTPCGWRFVVQSVCLAISSLFIIFTLIVYIGIPELRRRIGGVCLVSELVALLVSQITLIILQTKRSFSEDGCLSAGIIELIFVLASFFWLNVMCYDVWSTFRVLRPYSEKIFQTKIFIKYSLYAWGIPLLVGIIAVVMQKQDVKLKPNFYPTVGCFFADVDDTHLASHWIYLYGIILVLLLINVGFFIHLAITMIPAQLERRRLFKNTSSGSSSATNQSNQDVENAKLYAKLFIVMGIPWLIEVFTSLASRHTLCYIWFLDLFNLLRGVLIFIIFVCKKSTRDMIVANWCPEKAKSKDRSDSSSSRSRKTSVMSLSTWLPSMPGRKISKMSTSGHLEVPKEEVLYHVE